MSLYSLRRCPIHIGSRSWHEGDLTSLITKYGQCSKEMVQIQPSAFIGLGSVFLFAVFHSQVSQYKYGSVLMFGKACLMPHLQLFLLADAYITYCHSATRIVFPPIHVSHLSRQYYCLINLITGLSFGRHQSSRVNFD